MNNANPTGSGVDILLGHSYFLKFDAKQQQKMRPYTPLATIHLAQYLREAGYSVALFDAMLADGEEAFAAALEEHDPKVVVLYEDNFNWLSKMCLRRMREAACTMAKMSREKGATVIVSGSDVTDHPEVYLSSGAQYAIYGEGDHTVRELVDWLRETPDRTVRPEHIDGLVLPAAHGADGVIRTAKRANERKPDIFGMPARDLLDIDAYRQAWTDKHGYFSLNMVSTRGCPFHCNWCAKPIWGQRYAMRSAAQVAQEMAHVKETYNPDHLWFADDIFGLRASWVEDFGREVAALDAAIPFMIQSRADLMNEQSVAGLATAGCVEVWLGAESGSQKILDAMDKGTTLDEIATARQLLADAGIRAAFFIQLGYPGETWDDLMATVDMIREQLPDDMGVSVSYPLPGTRFHDMVQAQLGDKRNWDESGDLEMMFSGTWETPFYRHLHKLLHDDLDLHRRKAGLAPTQHLLLIDSDRMPTLDEHQERVSAGWAELEELKVKHRSRRATLIVRSEPMPERPDLSESFN